MADSFELTPQEAAARLNGENPPAIIDVREPEEFAIAHLEDAQLIPMQAIPAELQKLESLSDDADLLVFCHHGVRSLQVVSWLREHGIENCYSVTGGLDRWSREIDPGVPRY